MEVTIKREGYEHFIRFKDGGKVDIPLTKRDKTSKTGTTERCTGILGQNLKDVTIINLIAAQNEDIDKYAFQSCKLTSVSFPASLKEIDEYAFAYNQLTSVTFSEGIEIIEEDAFRDNKITSLTLPSSLKIIENMAFLNNNISSLTLPANTYIDLSEGGMFNNNKLPDDQAFIYARNSDGTIDYTTLVSYGGNNGVDVVIPSTVKTIRDRCFRNIAKLKSVSIPEGVKEIYYEAFSETALTEISLPSTILILDEYVFAYTSISKLEIPESINYINPTAFTNMSKLTSIIIDKEYNSIDGSPWGATNAAVEWTK